MTTTTTTTTTKDKKQLEAALEFTYRAVRLVEKTDTPHHKAALDTPWPTKTPPWKTDAQKAATYTLTNASTEDVVHSFKPRPGTQGLEEDHPWADYAVGKTPTVHESMA